MEIEEFEKLFYNRMERLASFLNILAYFHLKS